MNKRETELRIVQKHGSIMSFARTVKGASHSSVRQLLAGKSPANSLKAELVLRRLKEDDLLVEEEA